MNSTQDGMRPCWMDIGHGGRPLLLATPTVKATCSNSIIPTHFSSSAIQIRSRAKKYTTYEHTSNGMLCGASPHFCVLLTACRKSLPACTGRQPREKMPYISSLASAVQHNMDVKFLAKYGLESSGRILHNRSFASEHEKDWHMILHVGEIATPEASVCSLA
jgi:hypothetical protein